MALDEETLPPMKNEFVKLSHVIGVAGGLYTFLSALVALDINRLTEEMRHKDAQHQENIRQITSREITYKKELHEELKKLYQEISLLKELSNIHNK